MTSLRARLFVGLAALLLVTGLGAGALAFRWAFEEANELQDAVLEQVCALAVNNRLRTDISPDATIDDEARVVIQELGEAPDRFDRTTSPLSGLPHDLADGLETMRVSGKSWRVLVRTRADGTRVAVGQRTAARDEIARGSAVRVVLPLAALVPCLMLLVGLVIHFGFRPVSRLASRLDARESGHLEKLPLGGIPRELRPFVRSINRLLERIGAMFDQQRRFIADAAHELRTPVTALSLQAENLERATMSPEAAERLAILRTGIGRTSRLLEQLLALARYEAGAASKRPLTALDGVVREVVADLQPLAQSGSVDLGFDRIDAIAVHGDATALGALVRNLIDNALHHSPEGGRVDLSLLREGTTAIFRVDDTGPGVPESELGRLFEPFFRGSSPVGEGSGLGLAIARSIVESLDGSIVLENGSTLGRSGLRVTVTVPVKRPISS